MRQDSKPLKYRTAMSKKFMTVGQLRQLLGSYPDETLVAVLGYRDRNYGNIRLISETVPSVADFNGPLFDSDLCDVMSGKPLVIIEADNPY